MFFYVGPWIPACLFLDAREPIIEFSKKWCSMQDYITRNQCNRKPSLTYQAQQSVTRILWPFLEPRHCFIVGDVISGLDVLVIFPYFNLQLHSKQYVFACCIIGKSSDGVMVTSNGWSMYCTSTRAEFDCI